ncbi:MAG: amino acid adenylation domain-containing protein [Bacteroidota bacterium]|nr:amino acid adenylation domain-containing protein [Bacteroidota bacterium]
MSTPGNDKIIYKKVDFDPFADHEQPLVPVPVPTTESQREIWTNVQIGGQAANCAYNESVTLSLNGSFNSNAFRKAVVELFNRHDALRSVFSEDGMTLNFLNDLQPDVPLIDVSTLSGSLQESRFSEFIVSETEYSFDLVHGPLGKITIIKFSDSLHKLVLTFHHIVCDGWSLGIIMQDLGKMYSAFVTGTVYNEEPAISFREYAIDEQQYLESDENRKVEDFWLSRYRNNVPAMEMPLDKSRPAIRTFNADRVDVAVDSSLVERIRKTGAKQGCSFVTTLVASFEIFLHRITGLDDIVVGLPAAGQSVDGMNNLVGHAVNLLPLRAAVDGSLSFNEYLKKRKPEILDAYDHQRYTFGSLINQLNIPRDPSRIPLVPVSFNVDIGITNGVNFHGCEISFTTNPRKYENFEIFINASGSGNNLTLECTHNTDLFESSMINTRMEEFVVLMESIVLDPDQKISHLELLTPAEKHKVLVEWNTNPLEFDQTKCIHHLFESRVLQQGEAVAVHHRGDEITYLKLNEKANRLAHLLISKGAGPEILVGICMDRTIDMIVAMYAVLKSGSAYVPIDPSYPSDRISFILNDAKAPMVITGRSSSHLVQAVSTEIICLEDIDELLKVQPVNNPVTNVHSENQAYNIYTSGSTGKPKGVTIEHRNVNALTAWAGNLFSKPELDGVLGSTTICFDLSIFEIFVTLCLGGRLVLVKDILELPETNDKAAVTLVNTVPSALAEVMKTDNPVPSTVITVILCGEPLSVSLVNKIYGSSSVKKVYDLYGPTEDTVYSTCKLRKPDEPATIGKTIPNSQVYLLDKNQQPVPQGLPGEMYLGGAGVARGYLYRPELTAEKFITNPFSNNPGSRLYKTGDLVRFRRDGELEFIGRIDNQVKIRGFRVELGEIESLLSRHPSVRELVVVAREDEPGEKRIVAYLVLKPGIKVEIKELREFLKNVLPDYMVPTVFVFMDALPQTPNNKIDRKALPRPDGSRASDIIKYEEPKTPVEEVLAGIWCTVLCLEKVGRNDNFFELGGHSLIAVRMFNEVEKIIGVKVQLPVIFRAPTIAELAGFINNEESSKPWSCLVPLQPKGNRKPLFCIHMHNGNINRWRVLLKHLPADQPVYAIQPKGLDINQEPHLNIEEMARFYVDIVKSVQPKGPYWLLGLCFSGMVVFEMACLLEKEGEKVTFLGMINNYAPPENPTLYRIQTGIDKFLKLELGEKINYALDKNLSVGKTLIGAAKKLINVPEQVEEVQVDVEQKQVGHDLRTIHSRALLNYHPTYVYQGDIAIIRTGEPIEQHFNKYLGWDRLVKGKIETTIINGSDNDTIITDEPYNSILAHKVMEYLENTDDSG